MMSVSQKHVGSRRPTRCDVLQGGVRAHRAPAFSLIELLTVIFIISLLIAILIPSLNAARNAAKKSKTASDIRSLKTSLELFNNDNERDFPQTNGYPPSFAHPKIPGYDFEPWNGQFPLIPGDSQPTPPRVSGAHWLPAMLMGPDQLGYVRKSSVPPELRSKPWRWYAFDAIDRDGSPTPLDHEPYYLEPGAVKTAPTKAIRGRPPEDLERLWPDWSEIQELPVYVDAFDQPILYYAANKYGRTTNMLEIFRDEQNRYTGGPQQKGPAFYYVQDNAGFTGVGTGGGNPTPGWDLGGGSTHSITESGHNLSATDLMAPENRETLARFILDRTIARTLLDKLEVGTAIPQDTPLRPVNADSYLLISAGVDGKYGTADDVTNFPLSTE